MKYKEAIERITELAEKASREDEEARAAIEAARTRLEEIGAMKKSAILARDQERYTALKREEAEAEAAVEFYRESIVQMRGDVISRAEYEAIDKAIREEYEARRQVVHMELSAIADKITQTDKEAREKLAEVVKMAKALERLPKLIYEDADGYYKIGLQLPVTSAEKVAQEVRRLW